MRNKKLSTFDTSCLVIGRIVMWMLMTIVVLNIVILMGKFCGFLLMKLYPILMNNITLAIILGVVLSAIVFVLTYFLTSVRFFRIEGKVFILFRRIIKRKKRQFIDFKLNG